MTEAELEQAAADLEADAGHAAGGPLLAAALGLLTVLSVLWSVYGATAEFRQRLLGVLADLPGPTRPDEVLAVLAQAAILGANVVDADAEQVAPSTSAADAVREARHRARHTLDQANMLAHLVETFDDVVRVAAVVRQAAETGPRAARWAVNRAIADATTERLDRLGLGRIWVAEGDACPHCRAYHSLVAGPGQPFPTGLTLAAKPLDWRPVPNPPRHPNCRCRVWPDSGPLETLTNGESSG